MSPTTLISADLFSPEMTSETYASYEVADLRPSCAREANANAADLRWLDIGNPARLTDGGSQRLARLLFADADHVAGPPVPAPRTDVSSPIRQEVLLPPPSMPR